MAHCSSDRPGGIKIIHKPTRGGRLDGTGWPMKDWQLIPGLEKETSNKSNDDDVFFKPAMEISIHIHHWSVSM